MSITYQPETRTLKQIKRDYHRSLHEPLYQRLKTGSERIAKSVARGIIYLLLALAAVFLVIAATGFLHFVFAPLAAGLSVPMLLLFLLLVK